MYLRTLGGLSVEAGASDPPIRPLGPRRLALLAVVAAAGARGISREKVVGILWPDTDEEQAKHTLSQTIYLIRRETGAARISGATQLRLDASVECDLHEFASAIDTDDLVRAVDIYRGPFLDGFYLSGAHEFERWVEGMRARTQAAAVRVLETLARRAADDGRLAESVEWWRRAGEVEPFNSAYAVSRIRAQIGAGDPAGALRVAREYESRVRRELETGPDPAISELIAQLQMAPGAGDAGVGPGRSAAVPDDSAGSSPSAGPADWANERATGYTGRDPAADAREATPEPPAGTPLPIASFVRRSMSRWAAGVSVVAIVSIVSAVLWRTTRLRRADSGAPFIAIGTIQSRDTASLGPLLGDMLATNLARVHGIDVVAGSRLLELLPRSAGPDPAATADAARRAGANEIVEGELGITAAGFALTLRRVGLLSGRVLQGYNVRASDLYALSDSATAAIAQDFHLDPPPDAVATIRTRSAIAYALYEQGLRAFYRGEIGPANRLMTAALDRDSTFAMAAFFAWLSLRAAERMDEADRALPRLQRLASRTVDRERLWIEGTIAQLEAPVDEFLAIAREMTRRFPNDPDGQILLGKALQALGDWPRSVDAFNRAIAIDSIAGATSGSYCRVCAAAGGMEATYLWWDSAAAAQRTADRLIRFRPTEGVGWAATVEPLLRLGRRAEAEAAIEKAERLSATRTDYGPTLDRDLVRQGRFDELDARLIAELQSTPPGLTGERPWLLAFSLRNQGRLREARRLAADGVVPGSATRIEGPPDIFTLAAVALEGGQPREAERLFRTMVASDRAAHFGRGYEARMVAWHTTLAATAASTAGDTSTVRALADTVRRIGAGSSFRRDFTLHFFLEGLLLQNQGKHAEAVEAFRRSMFSVTEGFTRINLEMARSLMALHRYDEAASILQPAFRGGVDGGNTWITHTELHEALAHAFDAAGQPDSAAVHHAAVERAWRNADPEFAERYRAARAAAGIDPVN